MDAQTQTTAQSTETYVKVLEWLHLRRKPLLIGAVAVAVIGLVWAFMSWKKGQDETDANAQLFSVPIQSISHSAPVSAAPLLELAKEYPGTAAGEHARLLGAEELFSQGKYPEAAQQFSDFTDSYPDSALAPQAKVGIAACLEAEGKPSEAITKYHEIILTYPTEMSIVSPAKLTLARLYEEGNQSQQALTYYSELARMLSQNPYDPWAAEARERASLLVSKHPELMRSQTSAAPSAAPNGFSISEASKQAASRAAATAAPKPEAAAPSGGPAPNLLTIPGASTNSTSKP